MEYLLIHGGSRGHSLRYELLWDGADDHDARHLCGLLDVDALDAEPSLRPRKVGGGDAQVGAKLVSSGPHVGGVLEVADGTRIQQPCGLQPDAVPGGAQTHRKAEAASSLAAVVAAAHAH
jgi:hypothetical protein